MPKRVLLLTTVLTTLALAGPIDPAKEKAMKADLVNKRCCLSPPRITLCGLSVGYTFGGH